LLSWYLNIFLLSQFYTLIILTPFHELTLALFSIFFSVSCFFSTLTDLLIQLIVFIPQWTVPCLLVRTLPLPSYCVFPSGMSRVTHILSVYPLVIFRPPCGPIGLHLPWFSDLDSPKIYPLTHFPSLHDCSHAPFPFCHNGDALGPLLPTLLFFRGLVLYPFLGLF